MDIKSYTAGESLVGKQYCAVKNTANGVVLAGAGERAVGILVKDSALKFAVGDTVGVAVCDTTFALAGANVAVGAELMVDATGRLITATAGNYVVAVSDEAGSVEERIRVQLKTYKLPEVVTP